MFEFIKSAIDWLLSPIKWVANKLRAKVTVKHELKVEKAINDVSTGVKVVNRKATELVSETCFSLVDQLPPMAIACYGLLISFILSIIMGFISQGIILPLAVSWVFYQATMHTVEKQKETTSNLRK